MARVRMTKEVAVRREVFMNLGCICPVNLHSGSPYFERTSFTSFVLPALLSAKPRSIASRTYISCVRSSHAAAGGSRSIILLMGIPTIWSSGREDFLGQHL